MDAVLLLVQASHMTTYEQASFHSGEYPSHDKRQALKILL